MTKPNLILNTYLNGWGVNKRSSMLSLLQYCYFYCNYYWKWGVYMIIAHYLFNLYFQREKGIMIKIQPSQNQHSPHQQAWKVFAIFVESMLCPKMKKSSTPGLRLVYVYKSTLYQQNWEMEFLRIRTFTLLLLNKCDKRNNQFVTYTNNIKQYYISDIIQYKG